MRVDIEGVYPVEAGHGCHLIEVLIREHVGKVDLMEFTQEVPGRPRGSWQVPWDERLLNSEGTRDVGGRFPREVCANDSPLRLAFFLHGVDINRPLKTPAGDLALPSPCPRPERLSFLTYEAPD